MLRILSLSLIITSFLVSAAAFAGEVSIENARISPLGGQQYLFDVTLKHQDSGWDHYADRWDILSPDGVLLATRTLYHPHVNEQPFTRSLTVTLPSGTGSVVIRAHDSVHGYAKQTLKVDVPKNNQKL